MGQHLTVFLIIFLALCCFSRFLCFADRSGVQGISRDPATPAVLHALARLRAAGITTSNETDFLRRIAFVETFDGLKNTENSTGGGIWAVDRSLFLETQSLDTNWLVTATRARIKKSLGISWVEISWSDLADPLHSALAAHLVLLLPPAVAPPAVAYGGHLTDQAAFWQRHYNPRGSEKYFARLTNRLDGMYNNNGIALLARWELILHMLKMV